MSKVRADPDRAFDRIAATGFGIRRFSRKKVLASPPPRAPSLFAHTGSLFPAWRPCPQLHRLQAQQRAEARLQLRQAPAQAGGASSPSVPFCGRVMPAADGVRGVLLDSAPGAAHVGVDWISQLPLPETLARADLELIYTTEQHGWGLQRLYHHCPGAAPTLLLVCAQAREGEEPAVFGALSYAPWQPQRRPFGDGRCLLFRVKPSPAVFPWRGREPPDEEEGGEEPRDDAAAAAAMETFVIATPDMLSLGAAVARPASGLRLDETLERGSSEPCDTYGNEPLHAAAGADGASAFGVACVEVYRFRPQRPRGREPSS